MRYILLSCLLLAGCAEIQRTEMLVSKVVSDYCLAPEKGRDEIQKQVHEILKPNTIKIVCAADQ
jgi:hypothetical protein